MDKKFENLRRLVRDLESRYGKDDVDVKCLIAEFNLLEATKLVADLAPTSSLHSLAKQQHHGFKHTELT